MRFDLQTRLGWFDGNHVQLGSQVRVVEANEEGEAEVTISSTNRLLLVNTSDKSALRYLSQRKVADGTICEFLSDDAVILHLMECKRTVKENTWRQGLVRILDHGFKHQKVPLDHQGLASITF